VAAIAAPAAKGKVAAEGAIPAEREAPPASHGQQGRQFAPAATAAAAVVVKSMSQCSNSYITMVCDISYIF